MERIAELQLKEFMRRESLPHSYMQLTQDWLQPLAEWLSNRFLQSDGPLFIGIHGAQGSGKTTLTQVLSLLLGAQGRRVQWLSLDDFYLPKAQRLQLAADVHPLFATRGVPGTHDIGLLQAVVAQLLQGERALLPVFDKASDDQLPPSGWTSAGAGTEIVLLEGWCLGCVAASVEQLEPALNPLEAQEDADGVWRRAVNNSLAGAYADLFACLDALVMLQVPSMAQVVEWRRLQEQKLALGGGNAVMQPGQIDRFVQHFERLTRYALEEMPQRADYLLELDTRHNITAARIKSAS